MSCNLAHNNKINGDFTCQPDGLFVWWFLARISSSADHTLWCLVKGLALLAHKVTLYFKVSIIQSNFLV